MITIRRILAVIICEDSLLTSESRRRDEISASQNSSEVALNSRIDLSIREIGYRTKDSKQLWEIYKHQGKLRYEKQDSIEPTE